MIDISHLQSSNVIFNITSSQTKSTKKSSGFFSAGAGVLLERDCFMTLHLLKTIQMIIMDSVWEQAILKMILAPLILPMCIALAIMSAHLCLRMLTFLRICRGIWFMFLWFLIFINKYMLFGEN